MLLESPIASISNVFSSIVRILGSGALFNDFNNWLADVIRATTHVHVV